MANVGTGCTTRSTGLPDHNPRPSTPRGKRRHAARSPGQQKAAEEAWSRGRTTKESKYQKRLNESGKLSQQQGR